jgi:hypothetical protein
MKRPSVLVLLVFAFAGGNLFMGISSNSRGVESSSGTRTKRAFLSPVLFVYYLLHLLHMVSCSFLLFSKFLADNYILSNYVLLVHACR